MVKDWQVLKDSRELTRLNEGDKVQLTGTVSRELFRNENSCFSTYLMEDNLGLEFNISGVFEEALSEEQQYEIHGIISEFRGRRQIKADYAHLLHPISKKGIISYLETIKGVGEKLAKAIYKEFGDESLEQIKIDCKNVAGKVKGLSEAKATEIQVILKTEEEKGRYLLELLDIGVPAKIANQLIDDKGYKIVGEVRQNPYILAFDRTISGFGFAKCDDIAKHLNIEPTHSSRIRAGIDFTLTEAGIQGGHCYLSRQALIADVYKLLAIRSAVNVTYIQRGIDEAREAGEIILLSDDKIYSKRVYEQELTVASCIRKLTEYTNTYKREEVEAVLDEILKEEGIDLEINQREACIEMNLTDNGFYILEGSAGTGKTFCLNLILKVANILHRKSNEEELSVSVFAPTGKAAKVASLSTGRKAQTIHKGLKYNANEKKFEFNENNPLLADVVVVDESSMLDISLASNLLKAISPETKVIFMGDTKQLPSVGAGNVLKDLINSEYVKVISLTVVKRQGELSDILKNANHIIRKEMMVNYHGTTDAFIIQRQNDESILNTVLASVKRMLTYPDITMDEVQVLSCQRKGTLGVWRLNYEIQKMFNPFEQTGMSQDELILAERFESLDFQTNEMKQFELYFHVGDRVINVKNDYEVKHYTKNEDGRLIEIENEKGVMNGDTGVIEEIKVIRKGKSTNHQVVVKFDEFYAIFEKNVKNLNHAYALTIHKSQGSAWKSIIIPMSGQFGYMLENALVYTAWTRAREKAVVIGDMNALYMGITRFKAQQRNTDLTKRISDCMSA